MACGNRECKSSIKEICAKITYISVHLALISLVLFVVVHCLIVFSKWPTYTQIRVVPQQMAEFPSLTICPGQNGYKEDILKVIKLPIKFMQSIANLIILKMSN